MLDARNASWEDNGEASRRGFNQHIQYREWRARYPKADLTLVPIFETLLANAEAFYWATGKHLRVYGDLGELFGALTLGMSLHKDHAQGSDGRVGNNLIEVKTIGPLNTSDQVIVDKTGNFNQLLVVKISRDFEVSSRLIDRKRLPKRKGDKLHLKWADLKALAAGGHTVRS